ncbi:hypothetical protein V1504DRAFT_460263 [Lipomyces starkeyi]
MNLLLSEARLLLAEDDIANEEERHDDQYILSTLDYRLILPAAIVLMIEKLQGVRYVNNREPIPRSSATLDLLLTYYHDRSPKIFRNKLRVYPETIDALVGILREAPVFATMTARKAKSVKTHLAMLLYRLQWRVDGERRVLGRCWNWHSRLHHKANTPSNIPS